MANDSPLNKIRKNVSFHGGIPGSPDVFAKARASLFLTIYLLGSRGLSVGYVTDTA